MIRGLVTVIIPVYNVEKYLDRCVFSVVNQTYRNLEIILVDDGSPDRCPQMCDEWAQKDSRIRVIHKVNEGLGMARNAGIENSTGEYICFLDSDDYIDLRTIDEVYSSAVANRVDLVCYGMQFVDNAGRVIGDKIPAVKKNIYRGSEVQNEFLIDLVGPNPRTGKDCNITMSSCCKLISMKCVQKRDWRFVSEREIIAEDFYSMLGLYPAVDSVYVLPKAFYYYCENLTSLSRSYRNDRYTQACHFYLETVKLCKQLGYSNEVSYRFGGTFLSFVITALKQLVGTPETFSNKLTALKQIVDDDLLQRVLEKKKYDKIGWKKNILFNSIRKKKYILCYVLLMAQTVVKK